MLSASHCYLIKLILRTARVASARFV